MPSQLTVIKKLPAPWKVGGQEVKEIEVRPATMEDVCAAEEEVSPSRPNAFNVQMACLQIVRAGSYTGPFVPAQFKAMRANQFGAIIGAMREADTLGEEPSAGERTSTET